MKGGNKIKARGYQQIEKDKQIEKSQKIKKD